MRPFSLLLAGAAAVVAQNTSCSPFDKYTISAEGINATYIGYGATLTNLYVKDKNGTFQDVVVGHDTGEEYFEDGNTNHTYFGAVVGRYANRIKNGTFTIDGVTSHIPENEHGGLDTLHGGFYGYDRRNWTLVNYNQSTITFSFLDDALQGFPGRVITYATYTVSPRRLTSRLVSLALDEPTPIMLANHIYWNLGAFVNQEASLVTNDTLHMPYSKRYIVVDSLEVPTGEIATVASAPPLDFTKPKTIGKDIMNSTYCGANCTGYDNAFILDRPRYSAPEATDLTMLTMSSPVTGIKLDVKTNQQSLQIYSCVGQNGTIPLKADQQHVPGTTQYVDKYGCLVIETQQWIDGINNPQWGQQQYQIYRPMSEPAVNFAQYDFSIVDSD